MLNVTKEKIQEQTRTHIKCEYCGLENEAKRSKCTGCGAGLRLNKKRK